jgi:predicted phosphodiesterase
MLLQIASDLHHEHIPVGKPGSEGLSVAKGVDVLVLAGDIHSRTQVLDLYGAYPIPVVYVHGNHELYQGELFGVQHQLRLNAEVTSVRFLERDEVVLENVRFLGCCLWTDYRLRPEWRAVAMREAEMTMTDHRAIRYVGSNTFSPRDAEAEHRKAASWLEDKLSTPFHGTTVVVTHHAPHPNSIPAEFTDDVMSAAFASNLTPLVERADLWIHGHVHRSADYVVGNCRVICNPRGYPQRYTTSPVPTSFENADFDPALVIDI